jgi:hypothetical protein
MSLPTGGTILTIVTCDAGRGADLALSSRYLEGAYWAGETGTDVYWTARVASQCAGGTGSRTHPRVAT